MSNSNKVSIDKLGTEIMKALTEYKEDINEEVKEISDRLIKEANNELKTISPKTNKRVYLRKFSSTGESDWVEPRKLCEIMEYKKWQKS